MDGLLLKTIRGSASTANHGSLRLSQRHFTISGVTSSQVKNRILNVCVADAVFKISTIY